MMDAAKGLPFIRLYPRDFLSDGDVDMMSTLAVGAELFIACKAWLSEDHCTVPDDDAVLARWARVSDEDWKTIRPQLLRRWKKKGKQLISPWLQREYLRVLSEQEQKREAGKKGAAARHGKGKPEEKQPEKPAQSAPRQTADKPAESANISPSTAIAPPEQQQNAAKAKPDDAIAPLQQSQETAKGVPVAEVGYSDTDPDTESDSDTDSDPNPETDQKSTTTPQPAPGGAGGAGGPPPASEELELRRRRCVERELRRLGVMAAETLAATPGLTPGHVLHLKLIIEASGNAKSVQAVLAKRIERGEFQYLKPDLKLITNWSTQGLIESVAGVKLDGSIPVWIDGRLKNGISIGRQHLSPKNPGMLIHGEFVPSSMIRFSNVVFRDEGRAA